MTQALGPDWEAKKKELLKKRLKTPKKPKPFDEELVLTPPSQFHKQLY